MERDFSIRGIFKEGFNSEDMIKKESTNGAHSLLISKAQNLGINIGKYCTYDEDGKLKEIDTAALNAEVAKVKQEKKALENSEADSFSKNSNAQDAKLTEEDKSKATSLKHSAENEYKQALMQYANAINDKADSTTEEGKTAEKWEELKATSQKYLGVTSSNTTVLEGAKEFINSIYKVVNDTKSTIDKQDRFEKETALSVDSQEEISFKDNKVEVYDTEAEDDTDVFADAYLKSAMKTFGIEVEEEDKSIA